MILQHRAHLLAWLIDECHDVLRDKKHGEGHISRFSSLQTCILQITEQKSCAVLIVHTYLLSQWKLGLPVQFGWVFCILPSKDASLFSGQNCSIQSIETPNELFAFVNTPCEHMRISVLYLLPDLIIIQLTSQNVLKPKVDSGILYNIQVVYNKAKFCFTCRSTGGFQIKCVLKYLFIL